MVSRKRRRRHRSLTAILLKYFFCSFFCGIAVVAVILCYFSKDLPDLHSLKTDIRNPSVVVQTYDGIVVGSYGDLYETVIKTNELPKHVPAAFMAVEDRRFMYHFGIDFIGLFRAVYRNFISGRVVEGGSTLTQQLAKNILIAEGIVTHYDRSISRKIRELLLSIWLEYKFNKSQIMMMYLNRIYFGAGTYGIDAASRKYFGKSAKQLSVYEAAVLAGLLKAPSKYSPTSSTKYAKERAFVVLKAMEEQGIIKSAKEVENREADLVLNREEKIQSGYMYFCDFVYDQAQKILGDITEDVVIVSTFDIDKQKTAEESVKFYFDTESERYKISQMAFVCIGRDGDVQCMVGGKSYTSSQFNRVTQALRMSGSAFKIFVYGAALEYGYQLHDTLSDAPVTIAGWTAKNYKWRQRGEMSLLDGFTYSVNSVCIRLAQQIGIKRVASFANKLGISNVSRHDMSVAIGTTPLTLKDLTCAYATFMDGFPIWSYGILEIRTKDGRILYSHSSGPKKRIIDDETLYNCRELLRSVIARGTGRATNVNEYIYGKTGSNGDDDAWFIGFYDPKKDKNAGFAIGVWCGNDNNKLKMTHDSTGGRIPARIAARFIKNVLNGPADNEKNGSEQNSDKIKSGLDSVLDAL
ncbi:MAG: transglycosylase domain-containing protein [Holosporales bacterium]|jgi:penicillin-binding protein 1A|nr:transglycosylase domain-containing protein [Holosporales bacterium]